MYRDRYIPIYIYIYIFIKGKQPTHSLYKHILSTDIGRIIAYVYIYIYIYIYNNLYHN